MKILKVTEQCFPWCCSVVLYKMVLAFESVDEILKCNHSDECYRVELSSVVFDIIPDK